MPRTINFLGSVALLVSSITGPSLVIVPLLFQQAGWLTPLLTFAAMALLSGAAALFVVEAMSSIEGNERFQAAIEFTTIAHLFLGKRWHIAVQALLYLAMQTLVVASLLESFQSMDDFLINTVHKTCAVSFKEGWVCVNQMSPNGSSPFSGYILGSFGTLITLSLILPLSLVRLVDNIIFQVASFILLLVITIIWIIIFAVSGLDTHTVPVVGRDQSTVVGFVLSNFSFVTTIPAWVNNTHPSVDIRLAVWLSILISCLIYIPIGWLGGLALLIPDNATLLQVFATDAEHGALRTVGRVSSYLFPLAVLITSIPVFTIVIRYNLLRGNMCSNKMAIFWSAIFPWIIAIPFQTNGGITIILNWASLIFTSPANLLVPFILFVVSKRHLASAVLDANVLLETSPIARTSASATPAQALPQAATPVENIPVVIITDSTDGGPDSADESKMLMSRDSGESTSSEDEVEKIPMSVTNRVSSPSKHRYYGQEVLNKDGESSASASGVDRPMLFLDTTGGSADTAAAKPRNRRRPSLSISLSPTHSITHSSNTGMDEFLLMSPTSPEPLSRTRSVRDAVLGTHSPHPSVSVSLPDAPPPPSLLSPTQGTPIPIEPHQSAGLDAGQNHDDVRIFMSAVDFGEPMPATFKAFPCLRETLSIRSTHISVAACILATILVLIAIVYGIISST